MFRRPALNKLHKTYDPHAHRKIKHPITNAEAFASIIKSSFGTGCLEMPGAFCNSGWAAGIIGTFLIGGIMVYAAHLLIRGMYEICIRHKEANLTYPQCMRLALLEGPPCLRCFSVIAVFLVDLFMCLYYFGVCCVYIVFIADNIKQLVDFYYGEYALYIHVFALTLPVLSIFLIRDLKALVPFNTVAYILLVLGFLLMIWFILSGLPSLSERIMFNKVTLYPLYFGTMLFATESVGVMIAIENEMATPKDFLGLTGILSMSIFVTSCFFAAFGFFGYWRYGCSTNSSITANLPSDIILSQVIKVLFAVAIYLSYALQGYIIVDVLWHHYISHWFDPEDHTIMEYDTRCSIALATVFVAVIIPDISIFQPLIASICLTILGFLMPGLLDLCVRYKVGYGPYKYFLIRDICLICFGILSSIIGVWVALKNIQKKSVKKEGLLHFINLF